MRAILTAAVLALACGHAFAALSERDALKLRLQFLEIKDDGDLYVGQGSATLKDQGDWDKAELAATAAARASLAEAIEVHVQSRVTDTLAGNAQGVTENTEAVTRTESDLKLANVKTKALRDFPQEGTLTVLAYLSKKDYRRQLAGKAVELHVRESGVGFKAGLFRPTWAAALREDTQKKDLAPLLPANGRMEDVHEQGMSLGIDVFWRGIILGIDWTADAWSGSVYDPVAGAYKGEKFTYDLADLSLGWDYTPWNWAIQPYVPLRLNADILSYQIQVTPLYGASAGVGVRFWPNDSVSLDVSGLYTLGFNSVQLMENDGKTPTFSRPGKGVNADLTGTRGQIGISISGF